MRSCRTRLSLAADENLVMVRLNLNWYTVPYYHPFTRNYCENATGILTKNDVQAVWLTALKV